MAYESKIQWTETTWNPWHGCKKVSPGCKFCYMYRDKERYGQDPSTVLRSKSSFNAPLRWDKPRLIFTCSWSDWFIEEADEWRAEAWEVIRQTPQHTYQILTKRPERIMDCLPPDWGDGYDNVWMGVSIEGQDQVHRMGALDRIPAKTKFLSLEPLIAPVDLYSLMTNYPTFDDPGNCGEPVLWGIDWVIIGGESGNESGKYRYRPCSQKWIKNIILQCKNKYADIPVFVKQLGAYLSKELFLKDRHGGDINEWPEYLRVREMPKVYHAKLEN